MTKRSLLALVAVVVVGVGLVDQYNSRVFGSPKERQRARGTDLHAAAREKGSYATSIPGLDGAPVSLDQLVGFSKQILIAVPESNVSRLSADGKSIVSYYKLTVERVLKSVAGFDNAYLAVPGGRVGFEDGTWAQQNLLGYKRPMNGKRYLLFLRDALGSVTKGSEPPGAKVFRGTFGPLGVYELPADESTVRPQGGHDYPFAGWLRERRWGQAQFLDQVQQAIINQ
jgi:hypothetical protein